MNLAKHMKQIEKQANTLLTQYERGTLGEKPRIRAELDKLAEETLKLFEGDLKGFLESVTPGQNPFRVQKQLDGAIVRLRRIVSRMKSICA